GGLAMPCRVLSLPPGPLCAASIVSGCIASAPAAARPARPAEAHAMRNGFAYLGARTVNGSYDHDVIHVPRQDGQFHQLMIVVERAPVEIYDLVITFGNGDRYEPQTRLAFGPDTTSRNIHLPRHPPLLN